MQRQENNKNFFTVLGIEPTLDYSKVREAYKQQLILNHPDVKAGDDAQAKEIIEAWSELQEPSKLQAYYLKYSKQSINTELFPISSIVPPDEKEKIDSTTLCDPSKKFSVLVPILFSNHDSDMDHKTDTMLSQNDVKYGRKIDFETVAKTINTLLATKEFLQVGIDLTEVYAIVNQHTFLRRSRGCYAVEIIINLNDLNAGRLSEKDIYGPTVLSARDSSKYFSLKHGTQINSAQIISIHLAIDLSDDLTLRVESRRQYNDQSAYPQIVLQRKKPTPFEKCIFDEKFWKQFSILGLIPTAIKEMQKLATDDGIRLGRLYEIIQKYHNKKPGLFNFADGKESLAFYKIIYQSHTMAELQQQAAEFYTDYKGCMNRRSENTETKLLKYS